MSLKQVIRTAARRGAENIPAVVVSKQADGSYKVRRTDTGAIVRATPSNPADDYPINEGVIVSNPSGSGVTANYGYVIMGRPSTVWRSNGGDLGGSGNTDTSTTSGVTIAYVTPSALRPCSSEPAFTVDVYGTGFTELPTFTNPDIVIDSGSVIDSTHIQITGHWTWTGTPAEAGGLIFGTQEFDDLFAYSTEACPVSLYLMDPYGAYVVMETTGLTIINTINPPSYPYAAPNSARDGVSVAGALKFVTGLHLETLSGGVITEVALTRDPVGIRSNFVSHGGSLYYGSNAHPLVKMNTDGTGQTDLAVSSNRIWSIVSDGTVLWITDGVTLFKYDTSGGGFSLLSSNAGLNWQRCAIDGATSYVWALSNLAVLRKLNKAGLTTVSSVSLPNALSGLDLIYAGGYLYAQTYKTALAALQVHKIDPATMTVIATWESASDANESPMVADALGENIYLASSFVGVVHKIETAGMTGIESAFLGINFTGMMLS